MLTTTSQQLAWLALAAAMRDFAEIPANPVRPQSGLVPANRLGGLENT